MYYIVLFYVSNKVHMTSGREAGRPNFPGDRISSVVKSASCKYDSPFAYAVNCTEHIRYKLRKASSRILARATLHV